MQLGTDGQPEPPSRLKRLIPRATPLSNCHPTRGELRCSLAQLPGKALFSEDDQHFVQARKLGVFGHCSRRSSHARVSTSARCSDQADRPCVQGAKDFSPVAAEGTNVLIRSIQPEDKCPGRNMRLGLGPLLRRLCRHDATRTGALQRRLLGVRSPIELAAKLMQGGEHLPEYNSHKHAPFKHQCVTDHVLLSFSRMRAWQLTGHHWPLQALRLTLSPPNARVNDTVPSSCVKGTLA